MSATAARRFLLGARGWEYHALTLIQPLGDEISAHLRPLLSIGSKSGAEISSPCRIESFNGRGTPPEFEQQWIEKQRAC
jgi:hypothetical protein